MIQIPEGAVLELGPGLGLPGEALRLGLTGEALTPEEQ